MATIYHPLAKLPMGDPHRVPLAVKGLPSAADLATAVEGLILSASGWRKVFAAPDPNAALAPWSTGVQGRDGAGAGGDGSANAHEDSLGAGVSQTDLVIAGVMALVFCDWLAERSGRKDPAIILGIDTRPTGPALADLMARVWLSRGARPRQLFIAAAPELMAYSRYATSLEDSHEERAEGFCYISASHNPPAHNGVKFGTGGGVLKASDSAELIARFRGAVSDPGIARRIFALVDEAEPRAIAEIYSASLGWKRRAISAYTLFAREVVTGRRGLAEQEALLEEMAEGAANRPLGIIAELNGSARCLSIDSDFLGGIGVAFVALNDSPGSFAHRIVPEGASLEPARRALEAAQGTDPRFVAGYVPDCDGDRGNLVYWDGNRREARVLGAQEVFALAVLSELALLVRDGMLRREPDGSVLDRVAVVANDATSLRIDAIAAVFGAEARRAETGEANVVGLAAALRDEGWLVRILGEGSNGGNITHPAEVRDPLATLGALVKLLLLRGEEARPPEADGDDDADGRDRPPSIPANAATTIASGDHPVNPAAIAGTTIALGDRPATPFAIPGTTIASGDGRASSAPRSGAREGLFHIWLRLTGRLDRYRADFGLGDILDSLPSFATTSVFEPRAALRISERDHTALKERYLPVFLREWADRKEVLRGRFGITGWRALASLGGAEFDVGEDFAASSKGGLRIVFEDAMARSKGFIWMRGSGTEAVFRIMADIEGGLPSDEEWFLSWQASMVREADGKLANEGRTR